MLLAWLIPLAKPLKFTIVFGIAAYSLYQVRKPSRWFGRFFLFMMNRSHSRLTDWGLKHVQIQNNFIILDVGCGGGRTIQKLAILAPGGKIYGIDYAAGSLAASRSLNAGLIRSGRVEITRASVSALPFPENMFDLVTAVETQYYWPDLGHDMQEIRRVLKPGGTLVIVAETYKGGAYASLQRPIMKLLKTSYLSVADHRELFSKTGYSHVETYEEHSKGWFCGLGRKAM